MNEDAYNALLTIGDEIRAARHQRPAWLRLPSGLVLNMEAVQRIQLYDEGPATVYWSYEEGDYITLFGEDAKTLLAHIERVAR